MKLVQEKGANCGHLKRQYACEGNNKPLLPGDLVSHWQDDNSMGTVIAVSDDGRNSPDLEALVLWTKLPFNGNYPPPSFQEPTHIAEILKMQEQQMISKEYALRRMGYDPNARPDE